MLYSKLSALLCASLVALVASTPLDDYVWAEDPHYSWYDTGLTLHGKSLKDGTTWMGYVLNMTSQKWLDETITTRPLWWHILVVIVPEQVRWEKNATLWITGGSNNGDGVPSATDEDIFLTAELAMGCQMVVGALFQIPNEPMMFYDDPIQKSRSEDSIIAYTWDHFLRNTNDAEWLVRFPMVKASLRAMDTITAYSAQKFGYDFQHYVVTGASKRGWTTWDVGAVDPDRVAAIVPIVLDAINFVAVEHHQWRSYGGWSYALEDYYEMDIMTRLDTPEMELLQEMEDPYFYRDRLTMPKLVINAVGDEFQQPDDTWYWWNDMPEPKHFLLVPNAEHSLATGILEAVPAVGTWIEYLLEKRTIPKVHWKRDESNGAITVTWHGELGQRVQEAAMWYATTCNTERRDFRLINIDDPCTCGVGADGYCLNLKVLWQKQTLEEVAPNTYTASFSVDDGRWAAFLIDLTFAKERNLATSVYQWPVDRAGCLEFTTEVSISPNTFPYDDCYLETCDGPLL
jgi:PhoPQ-activated pathogenicity-related protein